MIIIPPPPGYESETTFRDKVAISKETVRRFNIAKTYGRNTITTSSLREVEF